MVEKILKVLFDFFIGSIWPVKDATESEYVFKWRCAVTLLVVADTLIFGIGGAYALGSLPGYEGFATRQEQQFIVRQLHALNVRQIEEEIRRTKIRQCQAIAARNQDALQAATKSLTDLQRDYRELMSFEFNVPTCMELLVPTAQ